MGTVTVTLVAVAFVTMARVAPKNTILLAAVVLKPEPVSVTASPGLAEVGLKEVMVGLVIAAKPDMVINMSKTIPAMMVALDFFENHAIFFNR